MAQNLLDQLCDKIAGCETLAFFDLSTRMVLLKNSGTPQSQDALNTMCKEAEVVLEDGAVSLLGSDTQFTIYLRSDKVPTDVLCCVCALDTDVEDVLTLGQTCLEEIGGGA